MMKSLTLAQRLTLIFSALVLSFCIISGWVQNYSNSHYGKVIIQKLSANLAQHIANSNTLLGPEGLNEQSVKNLFDQLMSVNPGVEVYLLDKSGNIVGHAAPEGRLKRNKVDLEPITNWLQNKTFPVMGDNPRSLNERTIFSVAPLLINDRVEGYLYVVLIGDEYRALVENAYQDSLFLTILLSCGAMLVFALIAGWFAFRWITNPIRQLTNALSKIDLEKSSTVQELASSLSENKQQRNEVGILAQTFYDMAAKLTQQWNMLSHQDQQRREFIANISHDLRTPLTSLQGYLETLSFKSDKLTPSERQRYLNIALSQSQKVSKLAQELFELARLEYGQVKLNKEQFFIEELIQDVLQKFELAAESRQQKLLVKFDCKLKSVNADLSMIERVLTNLLDNALRHTPERGTIKINLVQLDNSVQIVVSDTGSGIPEALKSELFQRPSMMSYKKHQGGLGLMIVKRILQLHKSDIQLIDRENYGACFKFELPCY